MPGSEEVVEVLVGKDDLLAVIGEYTVTGGGDAYYCHFAYLLHCIAVFKKLNVLVDENGVVFNNSFVLNEELHTFLHKCHEPVIAYTHFMAAAHLVCDKRKYAFNG